MNQIPKYEKPNREKLLKAIGLKSLRRETQGVWKDVRCVDWRGNFIANLDVRIAEGSDDALKARIFVTCPDCLKEMPMGQLANHSQKHRLQLHELPPKMGMGYDDIIAKKMKEAGQQTALNLFEEETHGTTR